MKYELVIILIILTILIRCTNDNLTANQVTLVGKWIDVNTKTDTLTFGLIGGSAVMILARGNEIRDGSLLPKYGSGPYDYKLFTGDKISLHWTLSSNSTFTNYYFQQMGDRLTIEKFFDTSTSGTLLTFKKIN